MLFPATSGPYSLWPAAGSQRLLVSLRVAAAAVCAVRAFGGPCTHKSSSRCKFKLVGKAFHRFGMMDEAGMGLVD